MEAVIESAERLFLNPGSGNSQKSLQLKNIAISWLFLFAKASLRYAYSYWLLKVVSFGYLIVLLHTSNDHTGKLKIKRKLAGT